jgi:hypothetical protein
MTMKSYSTTYMAFGDSTRPNHCAAANTRLSHACCCPPAAFPPAAQQSRLNRVSLNLRALGDLARLH